MVFTQGHALLIGVGSYANAPELNMPVTAEDAQALAAVLGDPAACGYPADQVRLLTGPTATRAGVLAALDTLAAQTAEGDIALVFYAGHGAFGDDGYALTAHDTGIAGGKVAAGTGIGVGELIDRLRAVKAQRLLLIVNACHAGALSPVLGANDAPFTGTPLPANAAAALLATGAGRVIIAACRDGQVSYVGPGPLTLFTRALVDGLRGDGVASSRGYISVFDLYTHLYFALDEAVARQAYGGKQEPELTILKGVGPFPVALYRGATTLGDFEATGAPAVGTAVREVSEAYSKAMLQQLAPRGHQQTIGGNALVGAAVAGDVQGDVNVNRQRGGVHFGSGGQYGDISIGDVAGRDIIKTGDITGSSGVAIGRGARSEVRKIDTGGGDYAEGNIDKRKGNFVSGDQFNLSGSFDSAIVNAGSTLTNVSQSIGASPHGDAAAKAELQVLIEQLSAELTKAPAAKAAEAEAVAETAKQAVEQAIKAQPNRTLVAISAEGLKQAAQNLAAVLPTVLPLAAKIAEAIQKFVA